MTGTNTYDREATPPLCQPGWVCCPPEETVSNLGVEWAFSSDDIDRGM